ncbi:MAG: hypothetical protein ACRDK4_04450 [Solirubrobacteraceae bacterium]
MESARGKPANGRRDDKSERLSKNQRRILTVMGSIAPAREQLIVAMEDISEDFDINALSTAAKSPDPRERNR